MTDRSASTLALRLRGRTRRAARGIVRETSVIVLLTIAAALSALLLRTWTGPVDSAPELAAFGTLVALQWLGLRAFRVHRRSWRYVTFADAASIAAGLTLGTGAHLVLDAALDLLTPGAPAAGLIPTVITGGPHLSAPTVLVSLLLASNLQIAVRGLRRAAADRRTTRAGLPGVDERTIHRALVVGAGDVGAGVVRDAARGGRSSVQVVGILEDDPVTHGSLVAGIPVRGAIADLERVARVTAASMVIVALDRPDHDLLRSIIRRAQRAGLVTRIRPAEPLAGIDHGRAAIRTVDVADLLPRPAQDLDTSGIAGLVGGRTVLVTGAGGSIGSELCRQLVQHHPSRLVLIDRSEVALWTIERELRDATALGRIDSHVLDIRDRPLVEDLLRSTGPSVVFHAAALKHVPIVERNVASAALNNVIGTSTLVDAAVASGVPRLVLISSDKAVAPSSIMGATKRIAERIVADAAHRTGRDYVSVRFGNVLGSSGSVVEVFEQQIAAGGPVTITDPRMTRYFMSIPEAAGLVLHAATLGYRGGVLALDMGRPHNILEFAHDLIRLHGLEPGEDIDVLITGTRPGEKLHEELADLDEVLTRTLHPSILAVRSSIEPWVDRVQDLARVSCLAIANDVASLRDELMRLAAPDRPRTRTLPEAPREAPPEAPAGPSIDQQGGTDGDLDSTPLTGRSR